MQSAKNNEINGLMGKIPVGDKHPVRIVGIINLSSASFYKRSISNIASFAKDVEKMIGEGADCIDIGAQSTRPIQIYGGAGRVDETTERETIEAVIPTVCDIMDSYPKIEFSIDTVRSSVAEVGLKKGIKIINDISGFKKDENMPKIISDYDATAILMAARKEPGDVYELNDIISELKKSVQIGEQNNIKPEKILIDPGIGSWEARPYHYDFNIIKHLKDFRVLQKPIYVGISRKTSIGKVLSNAPPEERLFGSIGATMIAIVNGAHVVRTHDVKATLDAIRVGEKILDYPSWLTSDTF